MIYGQLGEKEHISIYFESNTNIVIQEDVFENFVFRMSAILFRSQCATTTIGITLQTINPRGLESLQAKSITLHGVHDSQRGLLCVTLSLNNSIKTASAQHLKFTDYIMEFIKWSFQKLPNIGALIVIILTRLVQKLIWLKNSWRKEPVSYYRDLYSQGWDLNTSTEWHFILQVL